MLPQPLPICEVLKPCDGFSDFSDAPRSHSRTDHLALPLCVEEGVGLEFIPVLGDAISRFCLLPAAAAQLSSWSFRHPGGRPHARLAPRLLVPLDLDPRLPWSSQLRAPPSPALSW